MFKMSLRCIGLSHLVPSMLALADDPVHQNFSSSLIQLQLIRGLLVNPSSHFTTILLSSWLREGCHHLAHRFRPIVSQLYPLFHQLYTSIFPIPTNSRPKDSSKSILDTPRFPRFYRYTFDVNLRCLDDTLLFARSIALQRQYTLFGIVEPKLITLSVPTSHCGAG